MKIHRPDLVEFVEPVELPETEAELRERLWGERVAAGGLGAITQPMYELGWNAGFGDGFAAALALWQRATAKGTAISTDEWGRPLYVMGEW